MRYAGLGGELAGGIIGFVLVGYWIDLKLQTAPIALVVGASLGCIGGLYHLIRRAYQMQREFESQKQRQNDDSRP